MPTPVWKKESKERKGQKGNNPREKENCLVGNS